MSGFALQIDLVDGGTHHLFGSTDQQRASFEQMLAGWRTLPPQAYYTLAGNVGDLPGRVYRRDIADMRMVVGS